jgi:tetratricopeptide (TPR) repeat protein
MRLRPSIATVAILLFTSGIAFSQGQLVGHESHGGVGKVNFPNSCAPAVQVDFARGVAMLHSFWYSAGEQTFRDVLGKDPTCAIASWGIAAILMSNPLAGVGPTPKAAEKAQAAIDLGRRTGAKTQRERDYIESVAAYYQDWANRPERARQEARAKAFEALAARYPDDEAQIFSALYIAGTQSQADQTYAAYRKAAAILEKEFAKYPDHPGVAHYLIHVYDAPPLAAQGLTAARLYAGIAPDAPHALHMPSHIFTRVGAWEDSASTNQRSYEVAIRGNEFPEAYHASDYEVYADLQLVRDAAALSAIASAIKVEIGPPLPPVVAYASAAMPARYAVERGDWYGAMQLAPTASGVPYSEAITWFARALGAARSGDVAAAEQNAAELAVRHKRLVEMGNTYWATEVDVQQRAAAGWIAFAQKKTDDALKLMREAADLEDKSEKHIVTPGRILPARELLGDMLLEAGQPVLALKEYEASQQREPNRFRGYYGAARAAEEAGDRDKAAGYYEKLLALAKSADADRPELAHAAAFVVR